MSKEQNYSIKDIQKNKEAILEGSRDKIVGYTQFVEESNKIKLKMLLKKKLKDIAEAKADFEKNALTIDFKIDGTKNVKFGGKFKRDDSYVLDNPSLFLESATDYFKTEAAIKIKGVGGEAPFYELLSEKLKEFGDLSDVTEENKKSVKFTFETATIEIVVGRVSRYFPIAGSRGAKIDLSK